jgi:hypothetical protein
MIDQARFLEILTHARNNVPSSWGTTSEMVGLSPLQDGMWMINIRHTNSNGEIYNYNACIESSSTTMPQNYVGRLEEKTSEAS